MKSVFSLASRPLILFSSFFPHTKNSSTTNNTGRLLRRHHQLRLRRLPHQAFRGLRRDEPRDEARRFGDLRFLEQDVSDEGGVAVDVDCRRRPR